MNEELLNIMNKSKEESIVILCDKYNIMPFQAELIYNAYIQLLVRAEKSNFSNYDVKKINDIMLGLSNGTYLNDKTTKKMAKGYCRGRLKYLDSAISFLEEIGMEKLRIDSFITEYTNACKYEEQMLSEELDVHALNVQIDGLLEEAGLLLIQNNTKELSL